MAERNERGRLAQELLKKFNHGFDGLAHKRAEETGRIGITSLYGYL